MVLTIWFLDETKVTISPVEFVRLVGNNVVQTKTWGNEPVYQKNVNKIHLTYLSIPITRLCS